MAPSLRSPTDAPDAPLPVHCQFHRHPHHRARFPSLTEFPDSPSVYSHAYQSPYADFRSDAASFSRLSDSPCCPDFDDETTSTIRSLSPEDVHDDSDDADDYTDDASHRISLQGPKIRFHSRAPWETDDDVSLAEVSEDNARVGSFGTKLKGKASRADNLIRTFARGSSIGSRPSIDSVRSKVSATSSFEVSAGNYSSSRGALYDLARQSISTSSLASSSASVRSQNFARMANHRKFSHFEPHDSLSGAMVSADGLVSRVASLESVPLRPSSSPVGPVELPLVSSSPERHSHDQFVHPYANPDLVAYTPSPETIPFHHPSPGNIVGSDSNSTVTDSTSPRSAVHSVISNETSTTSLTSRDVPYGSLRVNGKEISSPISFLHQSESGYVDRSTKFLALHPPPTGFEGSSRNNLNPRPPAVTLITLQEAQARERFRGSTVHGVLVRSEPRSDDITEVPEDQPVEAGKIVHTRARSTSAGTRQTPFPLPPAQPRKAEVRDESPMTAAPGRTLKHKKSGFMRLFGGRNSESEKERPPIPPHADVYAEEIPQTHGAGKTSKHTLSKLSKSSPTLRGSSASNATLASTYSTSSGGDGPDVKGPSSRRRQPPLLSIVTKTSDHSLSTLASDTSSPMGLNFTPPPLSLAVPQSAPPGNGDFSGLKLRPVSTSFSSHFADMVAGSTEDLQRDVHTPSSAASSSTALSPFTPVSIRRSDDVSATAVEAPGEECLTMKGLQDRLVSAKKAWQQQLWELRGQIRDLTAELEDLRAADNREYCEACGRGDPQKRYANPLGEQQLKSSIVDRPRARTGDTARFASGN